jgi:hypothetical protein
MTRLFATAGTQIAVDKLLEMQKAKVNPVVVEEISHMASKPKELSDDDLVVERSNIEACSSSGKTYAYSSNWTDDAKQHLVEYASICGCKTVSVDPAKVEEIQPAIQQEASVSAPRVVTASKKTLDIGDVFGIDVKGDTSHLNKAKWEQISSEAKTSAPDVISHRAGAISSQGGGEDYGVSPHHRVKPGQNSVMAPDAIGDLLKGKGEDLGTSLRRQNAERDAIRLAATKVSDTTLAGKMKKDEAYGAYSNSRVHMTETMQAQPGIRDGTIMPGAFQKDVKKMPDRTTGEILKEQADQRKAGIQRQATESKKEFKVEAASKITLSDVFTMPEKWMPKSKETPKA